MSRVLWGGAALLTILAFVTGVLAAACDYTPAEPTGIEVDVDRAKPRPPLKAPKAPKSKTGAKK